MGLSGSTLGGFTERFRSCTGTTETAFDALQALCPWSGASKTTIASSRGIAPLASRARKGDWSQWSMV